MRPVRAVGLYLVLVFLGGALLSPWLYGLVQSAHTFLPGLESVAAKPFPRYVNRCFLVLAIVGLIPLLRVADLRSWRALGLGWRPDMGRQLIWGFVLGFLSLAAVVIVVLAAGAREIREERASLAVLQHFFKAGLTALAVAPLEELFFRGALFGALKKSFHWVVALVVSSAVYALVHFLERPGFTGPVSWHSGLIVLLEMIRGFSDMNTLVPGFLTLTVAGMVLGIAYQRSGSIHFSIGLHAGWIFWLRTYAFITAGSAAGQSSFYGTGKLINGWLAFVVLTLLLLLVSRIVGPEDPQVGWKERRLFQ